MISLVNVDQFLSMIHSEMTCELGAQAHYPVETRKNSDVTSGDYPAEVLALTARLCNY